MIQEDLNRIEGEHDDDDYDNNDEDEREGTITIGVSRGEIEKIKPVKKRISQRLDDRIVSSTPLSLARQADRDAHIVTLECSLMDCRTAQEE